MEKSWEAETEEGGGYELDMLVLCVIIPPPPPTATIPATVY